MLQATLLSLLAVVALSRGVRSDNFQCSPEDTNCDESSLLDDVQSMYRDISVPNNNSGLVTCQTPQGWKANQEYCFYAIDIGDPSIRIRVYYNDKEEDKDNVHVEVLKKRIDKFCRRDDTNDGYVKNFPGFMTREIVNKITNGSMIVLSDTWVLCCRFKCGDSLEKYLSLSTPFTEVQMAKALARRYIASMPRTALGVSMIEKITNETCMTEDFKNSPGLPLVSSCHSVIAVLAGQQKPSLFSGRMLFNRLPQPPMDAYVAWDELPSDSDFLDTSQSAFSYYRGFCPLSFKVARYDSSHPTRCSQIVGHQGYSRWCCCPMNMAECRIRDYADQLICVHGSYTHGKANFTSTGYKRLVADGGWCEIIYRHRLTNNSSKGELQIEMKPQEAVKKLIWVEPVGNIHNICRVVPNKALKCPHDLVLARSSNYDIICTCRGRDFCNHDMHYQKAEMILNDRDDCAFTDRSEHVFRKDLYIRGNQHFCPVYYDVALEKSMNLRPFGNMWISDKNRSEIGRIFTDSTSCHLVEVLLDYPVFKNTDAEECENKEHGYSIAAMFLPRLVLICSCAGTVEHIDEGDHKHKNELCDEKLSKQMPRKFTQEFESQLSRCMQAKSEFDVDGFNFVDHVMKKEVVVNRETRYCYQSYSNETGIPTLESGAVSSKNEGHGLYCNMLMNKDGKINTPCIVNLDDGRVFCCCRAEDKSKLCNELMIPEFIVQSLLTNHTTDSEHHDRCGKQCKPGDMGCFLQRWNTADRGQRQGCVSEIDELVQEDPARRHLRVCEIAQYQEKCTIVQDGIWFDVEPVIVCCCRNGKCPQGHSRPEIGRFVGRNG